MIDWFLDMVQQVPAWNTWIALIMYWIPLAVCAVGYTGRTIHQINLDVIRRREMDDRGTPDLYTPRVTVGTLFNRLLATVCPIVNILAAVFSVGYEMLRWIGRAFGDFFNIPLVGARPVKNKADGEAVSVKKYRKEYDPLNDL